MTNFYMYGLIIYLLFLLAIGVWASRRISDNVDFLVAGRRLGPLIMVGTIAGSFWGAGIFIAGPEMAYDLGYGLVLSILGSLFSAIILIFVLAAKLRKFAGLTIPDLLYERFRTPWMRGVGGIVVAELNIIMLAVEILAGGTVLSLIFGWEFNTGLIFVTVVFLAYTFLGGFLAVAITDLIQSITMVVGLVIAIPFILIATGGFSTMNASLAEMSPVHLDPFAGGFITPTLLIGWFIIFGLGNLGPYMLQRFYGARDQKTAVQGAAYGAAIGWLFMYLCIFLGVAAFVLFPDLERSAYAFPMLIMETLPPVLGVLLLSAGMAALISTSDSVLLTGSSALAHDLYASLIKKDATPKQRLLALRIGTIIIAVISLLLALNWTGLVYWLQAFYNSIVASGFVPVIVAALYWKRATKEAAIASLLGGSAAAIIWESLGVPVEIVHPVYAGVIVAVLLLVVVSLITPKPTSEELRRFF